MDAPPAIPTDWIIKTGNNKNFENSIKNNTWGYVSTDSPTFRDTVKSGDRLWFVRKNLLIAVATFKGHKKRVLGPLIAVTLTNEELGWTSGMGAWDMEIHYTDLYDLTSCNGGKGIDPKARGQCSLRKYKPGKNIDLPAEYLGITRYMTPIA
jgi:hypothetical protein